MRTGRLRFTALHFAIFCCIFLPCVGPGRLTAQQQFISSIDHCSGNSDCAAYLGDFDLLLHNDNGMVAAPGKKPENRSHILMQAYSYLKEHRNEAAYTSYFRYLSCVSGALWSERGASRTLFSAENIIETYFALAGEDGEITSGIQRACDLLGAYHSKFQQAQEEQNILQTKTDPLDPQDVWHSVLLESARRQAAARSRTVKEDVEAAVRRDQQRYCLFAMSCRKAENSPFARK
jgi:hypothetical protein